MTNKLQLIIAFGIWVQISGHVHLSLEWRCQTVEGSPALLTHQLTPTPSSTNECHRMVVASSVAGGPKQVAQDLRTGRATGQKSQSESSERYAFVARFRLLGPAYLDEQLGTVGNHQRDSNVIVMAFQ